MTFDVIVVGLGAMGSATAYHLARAGRRVLGLDRYRPPHTHGSSHGESRIIREAYFEHPSYVPLVQRAYELWADLERESGRKLFHQTGGLMIGKPDSVVVTGAQRSAALHLLACETLTSAEASRRFPGLRPAEDMVAVYEPRAGALLVEACVEAHLALAARHGATLHFDEVVTHWAADGDGVRVATARGEYLASRLVLTAGPWLTSLLPGLPLTVERQIQFWFEPVRDRELFGPERCPVHIWEHEPGRFFYGLPDLGKGVKVACHHEGVTTVPEKVCREVSEDEVAAMRAIVRRHLPGADGRLAGTDVCLYTNTPDENFLIDRHPAHRQVLIASPCSGHGFKFSSAIGEVVAGMAMGEQPRLDLSLFRYRWDRL